MEYNRAQKVNGTCEEVRNINFALKSLEIKVYNGKPRLANHLRESKKVYV
ncbi:hypothetical protein [Pedobacter antarcticus]|nr:hypothetical protein [Pedobacter antarcticus]SDL47331.1 hypothetical protein SAMN04488084_101408 [Pedobacter antarcticus]